MASAAKEKRLAESKIISAKADVSSAKLQREAADILDSKAAMQIRYLEVVKNLAINSKVVMYGDDWKWKYIYILNKCVFIFFLLI